METVKKTAIRFMAEWLFYMSAYGFQAAVRSIVEFVGKVVYGVGS